VCDVRRGQTSGRRLQINNFCRPDWLSPSLVQHFRSLAHNGTQWKFHRPSNKHRSVAVFNDVLTHTHTHSYCRCVIQYCSDEFSLLCLLALSVIYACVCAYVTCAFLSWPNNVKNS